MIEKDEKLIIKKVLHASIGGTVDIEGIKYNASGKYSKDMDTCDITLRDVKLSRKD